MLARFQGHMLQSICSVMETHTGCLQPEGSSHLRMSMTATKKQLGTMMLERAATVVAAILERSLSEAMTLFFLRQREGGRC